MTTQWENQVARDLERSRERMKSFPRLRAIWFFYVVWPMLCAKWLVEDNLGLVIIVAIIFLLGVGIGGLLL